MNRQGHFDRLFSASPDPWGTRASAYEARKFAIALAMLPRARYTSAFEPACGAGAFTRRLADVCDKVVAGDFSPAAAASARAHLADSAHVDVRELAVPRDWPDGDFDLVVFGEILYYLAPQDLAETLERARRARRSADILAVHALAGFDDRAIGADELRARCVEAWGPPDARYQEDAFEALAWAARGSL